MTTFQTFEDLSIPQTLAENLRYMNFIEPTPVQRAGIPVALEGRDILGTAQTGTGKTGAFGIPLISSLYADSKKDALILAPTRELAAQIHEVLRQLGHGLKMHGVLVVGGESFNRQADDLRRGADYIIATPGRLLDHLEQRTVDLSRIGILVLDEVDRMMDMGFIPQVRNIMRHVPAERQTLLFSATLPDEIAGLAKSFLKDPVRVAIDPTPEMQPQIEEETIRTTNEGKIPSVLKAIEQREGRILIFARTQSRTDRLARTLHQKGHDVVSLHGGRSQSQRKQALDKFKRGSHRIMVATDLAGRGIDVNDIEHVINYDLPGSREDYVHRIGRTGRFGKTGMALNLLVHGDSDGEQVISGVRPASRASSRPRTRAKRYGRR